MLVMMASGKCCGALVLSEVPDEATQMAARYSKEVLFAEHVVAKGDVTNLVVVGPHRGYYISLDGIIGGHPLSTATPLSWRYSVMDRTNGCAIVTIMDPDPKSAKPRRFGGLEDGEGVGNVFNGLRRAEKLAQESNRDYELRYFSNFELHFEAVWLHGVSDDIIIPVSTVYQNITLFRPYSEDEVFAALKEEVKSSGIRLKNSDKMR